MVKINTKSNSSVTFNTSDLYLNYVREKLVFFNKKDWESSMDKGVAFIGLVKLSCKSKTGQIVPLSCNDTLENSFNENEINLRRCDPTYCFSTRNSPVATTQCGGVYSSKNWEMKRNNLLDDDKSLSRDVDVRHNNANYKNRLLGDAFSRSSTSAQSNSFHESWSTTERQRNRKVENVERIQFTNHQHRKKVTKRTNCFKKRAHHHERLLGIILSIDSLLEIEKKSTESQSEGLLSKTNFDCIVTSKSLLSKIGEDFAPKHQVSRHVDDQQNPLYEAKLVDFTHRFEDVRIPKNTQELIKNSRENYMVKKRIEKVIKNCKVLILSNPTDLRSTARKSSRSKIRHNLSQECSSTVEEKDNSSNVDISPLCVQSSDLHVCKSVKHLVQVMRYNQYYPVYSDKNDHKAYIQQKEKCRCNLNKSKETDDDVIFLSVPVNKLQSSNITLIPSESNIMVHSKKPSIFKRLCASNKGSKKKVIKEKTEDGVYERDIERPSVRNTTSTNTSQPRILQNNSCMHCYNRFNNDVPFNYTNSIAPQNWNQYGPYSGAHYRIPYQPSYGSLNVTHNHKQCDLCNNSSNLNHFHPGFGTGRLNCIPNMKCSKPARSKSSLKSHQGSKCWMLNKLLKQGVHRYSQADFERGSSYMIHNYTPSDTKNVDQSCSVVSVEVRQSSCHKDIPKRATSNVSICTVDSQTSCKSKDGLKVIRDRSVGGSGKHSIIGDFYRKYISRKRKPHVREKVSRLRYESSDCDIISDRSRYRSTSNKGLQVHCSAKFKKRRDRPYMETPKGSSSEFSANSGNRRNCIKNVKQEATTQASQGDLKVIQYNNSLHFHQPNRDCNCGALEHNHACKSIQTETVKNCSSDGNLQIPNNIIPICVSHSGSSKRRLVKTNSVALSTRDLVTPSKTLRHDESLRILYPCKHPPVILPQCDYTKKKYKNAETFVKTGENSQAQVTPPIYAENVNNYVIRLYPDRDTGYKRSGNTVKRVSRKMDEFQDAYNTLQRLQQDKRTRKVGGCKQEVRRHKNYFGLKETFRAMGDIQAKDKTTDEQLKILKDVAGGVDLVLEKLKQLNGIMTYN